MFPASRPLSPLVPYTFPPISFLKLQDYITNLVNLNGGVYWPLDDVVNNPFNRVINPAAAKGRQLALTPDFATDTNWLKGTGCTIAGGVGVFTAVLAGSGFSQTILQIGRVYEVTFDIVVTVGTMRVTTGSGGLGTTRSVSGTYTEVVLCSGSTTLGFPAVTTFTGTIDNVSVKELNIPASTAVPIQLLNTDVWNNLGAGAWTAGNNANLSAQTTTRHDGISGTILRIQRNGTTSPSARQLNTLTVGQVYRCYGWARSDGIATPRVTNSAVTIAYFTGSASTDWQPFDFIFVADATSILLQTTTNTGTQFVEFDVTVVALDTGIRQDANVVYDADFENVSLGAAWVAGNSATLSLVTASPESGTQNLRVTSTGVAAANAQQTCICIGKRYRLITWYRGDGSSGTPRLQNGNTILITGTTSTTWTKVDIIFSALSATLILVNATTTSTTWAEFDNITLTELSPLVGLPVNGVIMGNAESNRLLESASFDGVNDLINLYSAQLNSVFNPLSGGLGVFAKVASSGVWTDGVARRLARLAVDGSNVIDIFKSTTNNTVVFNLNFGGTSKTITVGGQSSVGWQFYMVTWDTIADQFIAYINGVQVGSTQTGLGVWVGNITANVALLGALTTGAANPFSGSESHTMLFTIAPVIAQIAEMAKLGDVI